MVKDEKFKQLMYEIMEEFMEEVNKTTGKKPVMPLVTRNILGMLESLHKMIKEQNEHIEKLGDKMEGVEKSLNILIHQLNVSGYIVIGERRKVSKRLDINQKALIDLLQRKNIIKAQDLLSEIKRLSGAVRKRGSS